MNLEQEKYAHFALVREMMDAIHLVEEFDPARSAAVLAAIQKTGRLLLTGEGSSRIFPAKNAVRQAAGYDLSRYAVFCASNSGKTREVILLAQKLAAEGNPNRFALCAHHGTPLEQTCVRTFVLNCGGEKAVAATKSVVEQALFYDSLLWQMGSAPQAGWQRKLADAMRTALTMPIDPAIIAAAAKAPTIYFAGYNDGVAEELTLKTNEITRKKSDFLEGTYAVHGIEEVMDPADVLFVIDPIASETAKLQEALVKGVGLTVIAISAQETPFPTIRVPEAGALNPYLFLTAGWNLLVEIGLALGIDLDKPQRARKVGNEFTG